MNVSVPSLSISPLKSSSTVTFVSLTRRMPNVPTLTPAIPDTDTPSRTSKVELSYARPDSVSVTTLPSSVASVRGLAVDASTDSSSAVTVTSSVSAAPL